MTEVYARLNKVFRKVFGDPALVVLEESTAADVAGWDSLSHVNLVLAVEDEFGVRFTQRETLGFRNVGDLAACVARKTGAPG